MRVLERSADLAALGFTPMAVGFSPAAALAELAENIGWPHWFCSDEKRVLYRRLGLGSADRRQVFSDATKAIYAAARDRGEPIRRAVEDVHQLGGDALVVDGVVRVVFRPASPDDRPDLDAVLTAAKFLSPPPA